MELWGPYKWPCKWVAGVITLLIRVITSFITIVGAHFVEVDCLARPLPPDFIVTMRIEPQVKSRAQQRSQIYEW